MFFSLQAMFLNNGATSSPLTRPSSVHLTQLCRSRNITSPFLPYSARWTRNIGILKPILFSKLKRSRLKDTKEIRSQSFAYVLLLNMFLIN